MKKCVPMRWSDNSRMPAASKTGKDSSAMPAEVNHAQQVSGNRQGVIPGARILNTVVMKLIEPSSDATQKIKMLDSQSTTPVPCPGPVISPSALNGGYIVHPAIGPMTFGAETKKAASSTSNDTKVSQNDSMLSTGKAISRAPICRGKKRLPKPLCGAVVSTKKIMIVPCIVTSDRYRSGETLPLGAACGKMNLAKAKCPPGQPSCKRINTDSAMPMKTDTSASSQYCMPMILWSVLKT